MGWGGSLCHFHFLGHFLPRWPFRPHRLCRGVRPRDAGAHGVGCSDARSGGGNAAAAPSLASSRPLMSRLRGNCFLLLCLANDLSRHTIIRSPTAQPPRVLPPAPAPGSPPPAPLTAHRHRGHRTPRACRDPTLSRSFIHHREDKNGGSAPSWAGDALGGGPILPCWVPPWDEQRLDLSVPVSASSGWMSPAVTGGITPPRRALPIRRRGEMWGCGRCAGAGGTQGCGSPRRAGGAWAELSTPRRVKINIKPFSPEGKGYSPPGPHRIPRRGRGGADQRLHRSAQ